MWAGWQGGTFALPPGVDFAQEVVSGLAARLEGLPPQAMAAVVIYVNSGRTLRSLTEAFQRHAAHHGAMLLPQMRQVADIGAELAGARAAPLARRLELGALVAGLIAQAPDIGAGQSIPELAEALAALMAEMQSEGRGPDDLEAVDAASHAAHWQASLRFLRIAAGYYLTDPPVDPPARQRHMAEAVAQAWAEGRDLPTAPVLAVGSTGSHGATRLFLQAVARLPLGAVILPGYDFSQSAAVWDDIDAASEDHPQARLAALRHGVRPWTDARGPDARNALISLALRPAPVTDQWIAQGPSLGDLGAAGAGLSLIEADHPQHEADAIALAIRAALGEGRPVTLFAADSAIRRRVAAALDRWGIEMDDSAGIPLHLTQQGLFLRHVAALFGQPVTIDRLLVLLKHPTTATGADHGAHLRELRELELNLRARGPVFPDGDALRRWADGHGEVRRDWGLWLAGVLDLAGSVADDTAPRPLADRLAEHLRLAEMLAAGPGGAVDAALLWREPAGRAARAVLDHLAEHAGHAHPMGPGEYADLILTLLEGQAARAAVASPVRACGPREARTEANRGDNALIIMAGLNEGSWPQALPPDPFLSRQMRAQAGLTLPERQIGLSAHDFQQAIAAPEVILSRARRDADAETIPSRWLNRLMNLMQGLPAQGGVETLKQIKARGAHWAGLARAMASPGGPVTPAPRPAPIPPAPAFREISVTQVKTLIRDPYAIYASKVLRLRPLPALRPEPDPQLRGEVLHKIVERLLKGLDGADLSEPALRERFLSNTAKVLAEDVPWPAARIFWQARMARIADRIAADEARRLARGKPVVVERRGSLDVAGLDLRLTARPDRIDLLDDGAVAHIYDYKSGKPPSDKEMAAFDKQLMLEAAMVARGAFDGLGATPVEGVSYIQLGAEGETHPRSFTAADADAAWDGFVRLAANYLTGKQGFTARRAMQQTGHGSDYDQLSRYGEWGGGDVALARKVGDHG
ncbi:MAG: double-strand break repair protein AddB [Paracoccus sp. (in: a-proteobacteria)]|nr:double-strand break repair protein AddB [Paracoccus sp. (in: a-proteobacteria)]